MPKLSPNLSVNLVLSKYHPSNSYPTSIGTTKLNLAPYSTTWLFTATIPSFASSTTLRLIPFHFAYNTLSPNDPTSIVLTGVSVKSCLLHQPINSKFSFVPGLGRLKVSVTL